MFYMAYEKEKKRWAADPLFQGLLSISMMIDLYLFIIISTVIKILFKISIASFPENNAILVIIILQTIVFIVVYFIYGYKKKYNAIIEKYKKEVDNKRKRNRITVHLFVAFSILLGALAFIISVQH